MIRIESVKLFPQPAGFTDMYRRPFTMEMSNADLFHIQNTVARSHANPGNPISPTYFINSGVNLIMPQAAAESTAVIPCGWAAKRFSVNIRAVVERMGVSQVIQLEGFTDIADLSLSGHINPDTVITLSSYSVITQQVITQGGQAYVSDMVSETGYIANNRLYDADTHREIDLFKMRPADTLVAIQSEALYQAHRLQSPTAGFNDSRLKLKSESELFHTDVNNPAVYTAKLLNAARDVVTGIAVGQHNDTLVNTMATALQEPATTQNQFLLALANHRNSVNINNVTIAELVSMDPNVSIDVMRVGQLTSMVLNDQTTGWNDLNNDKHIVIGTQLLNILPQLAVRHMLPTAHFRATNMTLDGSWSISMIDYKGQRGFTQMHRDSFMVALRTMVMPVLVPYAGARISIDAWYDVNYEIRMSIIVDGYGEHTLRAPMWGNALYNPMVTNYNENLTSMARQVETLVSGLNQVYSKIPAQTQSNPYGY